MFLVAACVYLSGAVIYSAFAGADLLISSDRHASADLDLDRTSSSHIGHVPLEQLNGTAANSESDGRSQKADSDSDGLLAPPARDHHSVESDSEML